MFKINFRIVDDFEKLRKMETSYFDHEWKHISGFFQIYFGKQKEGCYYHEGIISEGETGGELLDYWFMQLLNVISLLTTETNYVAFKEIETEKRWLEFKRENKNVIVNVALDTKNVLTQLQIFKPIDGFSYIEPFDYTFSLSKLQETIIHVTKKFFKELQDLNPKLLETRMVLELKNKLASFEEIN